VRHPPRQPRLPFDGQSPPAEDDGLSCHGYGPDRHPDLLPLIDGAHWRQQKGVRDADGNWLISPHEYMLLKDEPPELLRLLRLRLGAPDAWSASYNGRRYKYVAIGGLKYWLSSAHGRLMANREPFT
jgi:hypothetical protein